MNWETWLTLATGAGILIAGLSMGVSFMPFAIVIAAASLGFATRLGCQTHLMVHGAGGYRFSDDVPPPSFRSDKALVNATQQES
jgi:hypothetical protein